MSLRITLNALEDAALRRVAEISGENIYRCMQCGTCSSVCPMSDQMACSPRRMMLMLQHGQVQEVVDADGPWLCASCHTCQVRCPRAIEVPRVVEAVRQLKLRQNIDHIDLRKISKETLREAPQIAMVSGFRKMTA